MGKFLTTFKDRVLVRSRSRSRSSLPGENTITPKPSPKNDSPGTEPNQSSTSTPVLKGIPKVPPTPTKARLGKSLWNIAYDELRNDNEKKDIIQDYEAILFAESQAGSPPPNGASDAEREAQMTALVKKKLEVMDEKQWRLKLRGGEVKVREQVDRIVKVVLLVKDFVPPATNLEPISAGLPLAGVCVLLSLFVNDTMQQTSAIDGFEYVSTLIHRFSQIERLYLQNGNYTDTEDLEVSMKKLYKAVLEYEARAARYFNRNTAGRAGRNILDADIWKTLLGQIKELEGTCDKFKQQIDYNDQHSRSVRLQETLDERTDRIEYQLKNCRLQDEKFLRELREIRTTFKVEFDSQIKNECFRSLRTTTYEDTMEKNPNRVAGTCEWFLKHPKYRQWLANPQSDILWVTADPGCGKSVLTRYLVKDYSDWMPSDTSICYYFFKDNSKENKSSSHAIYSILHQLFKQKKELIRYAVDEYEGNRNGIPTHFGTLWRILLQAAADDKAGTIICVIDALDESDELSCETLIAHLAEFYRNKHNYTTTKIKFLITSRPTEMINILFFNGFSEGNLDPASIKLMGENEREADEISEEINLVIDKKVEDFKRLREGRYHIFDDAHQLLKARLKHAENRTYLWLSLIYPEIQKSAGRGEDILQDSIKELPQTLDDAYEKILENSSKKEEARTILHIICAARRPLSLEEMNYAFSYALGLKIQPQSSFGNVIRDVCGLFISVQNDKVYLIHQTAKEFLTKCDAPDSLAGDQYNWRRSFGASDSNTILANACIKFLQSTESGTILNRLLDYPPFLGYAAVFWPAHFRAGIQEQLLLHDAIELCQTSIISPPPWFEVYQKLYRWQSLGVWYSPLKLASFLGLEPVVRRLLAEGADTEIWGFDSRTPLWWAARAGHKSVVSLLLKSGENAETKNSVGQSVLFMAARNGHSEVIDILHANGAKVNSKTIHLETPLIAAAQRNHVNAVQALLRAGADVDLKTRFGKTALSYAIFNQNSAMCRLLLDAGANPNIASEFGDSVIPRAVQMKQEAITTDLLEFGANPNAINKKRETPLHPAVLRQTSRRVQLLREHGADVNATTSAGEAPVSAAMEDKMEDIGKILLDNGADLDFSAPDRNTSSLESISRSNIDTPLLSMVLEPQEKKGHELVEALRVQIFEFLERLRVSDLPEEFYLTANVHTFE